MSEVRGAMREVRGVLWAALVGAIALPVVLAVLLGLGLLLDGLGDEVGWHWCRRLALVVGVAWVVAVVGTSVGAGLMTLAAAGGPGRERHRDDESRPSG